MSISGLTDRDVLNFLHQDGTEGDISPSALLAAATAYVKSYTGLTDADLYENRLTTVDTANVNRTVSCILGMHCKNLI